MPDTVQPTPTLAMRLIFEYEGDEVRLVSQMPVDLLITGFDISRTQRAGYYVDTRDASGQTLARVPARNVFSTSAEVFPEQPGESITRVEVPTPRGAFTVVVPAPRRRRLGEPRARRTRRRRCCAAHGARGRRRRQRARHDRDRPIRPSNQPLTETDVSTADGSVLGNTQIYGGAPRNRAFNVVLLADGFTAAQQNDFNTACASFVTAFTGTPPFNELGPAINIFRVNVTSTDSGADDPTSAGGTGATVRTYFDSRFGATASAACWSATRPPPCRSQRRRSRNSRPCWWS